ncbi:MAG TPA: hypothetical protein VJ998_10105 [Pseudomonadales bacterium]|nr:hypothetical protein [Pseudomonadales bacterium]
MNELLPCGFNPMRTAPKDGTEIEILFQHLNYHYADEYTRHMWQQICRAYWTCFNGGGWVWHGIAGRAICWRPIIDEQNRIDALIKCGFLGTEDAEFHAFVEKMPDTHWARYDLSAVRLGWEAAKALLRPTIERSGERSESDGVSG